MVKRPVNQVNQQLTLNVELNHEATLADFFWGNNAWLNKHLQKILHTEDNFKDRYLYIWGTKGSGKSHLLQACCNEVAHIKSTIYLPLKLLSTHDPDIIEGLEEQALITIDDIDVISDNKKWQQALFHLYNRVRDKDTNNLIISGRYPPNNLELELKDLQSRLNFGIVCQLNELSDQDKIQSLIAVAHTRGIKLSLKVGQFLLNRCTRNMVELYEILNKLAAASLAEKRKITVPFVKTILNI